MTFGRAAAFATILSCTSVAVAPALQDPLPTRIGSRPFCTRCRVTVSRSVTIPLSEEAGAVGFQPLVQADARGRLITTVFGDPSRLAVYSPVGSYVAAFSLPSDGPDRPPARVAQFSASPDSVFVLDSRGTLHVYSSTDWTHRRAITTDLRNTLLTTSLVVGRHMIVGGFSRTRARMGLPLHAIDLDLGVVTSFGPPDRASDGWQQAPYLNLHYVGAGRGDVFWARPVRDYVLQRYSVVGQAQAVFRRTASFYPSRQPRDLAWGVHENRPPSPGPEALLERGDGLLIVFTAVPARDWRRAFVPPDSSSKEGGSIDPYFNVVHSIVEVIDPGVGRVLTRSIVPVALRGVVGDRVWSVERVRNGVPQITLWSVTYTP
jgi:hypothetical protein